MVFWPALLTNLNKTKKNKRVFLTLKSHMLESEKLGRNENKERKKERRREREREREREERGERREETYTHTHIHHTRV